MPVNVKSNERELASKVAQWFQEHINRNNFPFKSATNETGVKVGSGTFFGDIVLWDNDETRIAYTLIELKPPHGKSEDLKTFRNKAVQLNLKIAYTWNFQQLNAYKIENNDISLLDTQAQPILSDIEDWRRGDIQAQIKTYIRLICEEVQHLTSKGRFSKFKPEKHYFIRFLRDTVNQLIPVFEQFIKTEYRKSSNKELITKYVAEQGISYPSDDEFFKLIANQTVYGLVTRIIFYLTIRRYFTDLPDLFNEDTGETSHNIREAFAAARNKDWQAVFVEGPIDELGIPAEATPVIDELLANLKIYNFGDLPEDIIGELFEEIIEPGHRHALGQYFTREDLVDFIIGTTVNDYEKVYADPTCGSGTFLIRLYSRLKYLKPQLTHEEILTKIWGIDIGKFPAELSTINLFRQDSSNFENFPRIIHKDIFDIHPGFECEFPPQHSGIKYVKIKERIPQIFGMVGNFPFIRQEIIEEKIKGYKTHLAKVIAYDHLFSYPELFTFRNNQVPLSIDETKGKSEAERKKFINQAIDNKHFELKLSGQADIYTYIFIHTATLLEEGGSMAIITSNSWLDVAYGSVLKQFFLDHFKIKMVVATWAEAWFDDAAVNTVFTVLEKNTDAKQRAENQVKFIKIKRPLSELIPFKDLKLESIKRWQKIDALVRVIETADLKCKAVTSDINAFENDDFRIRMISQLKLADEIRGKGEYSKWGKYLRAPDVYFEILDNCKDKLVPLKEIADVRFGIKTGINEFFYLSVVDETRNIYKNARNWQGFIEPEYLKRVIKSPKESESIIIDPAKLKNLLFVCNRSKDELRKEGHNGALDYIEWGEKQRTNRNIFWTDVPSVSGRKYWYSLNYSSPGLILMPMINNDRFLVYLNQDLVYVDHNLFEFQVSDNDSIKSIILYLNSSVFALIREVNSRSNLGEGATKTEGVDWQHLMLMPSKSIVFKKSHDQFLNRKILSVDKEVKLKERQQLDLEVLKGLGLSNDIDLENIHRSLVELVKDRLNLPRLRLKQKKQKVQISYDDVKRSVIEECIGKAVKRFPEDFYKIGEDGKQYHELDFEHYNTSGKPLRSEPFLGQYTLKDTDGTEIFTTFVENVAEFTLLVAKPGIHNLSIPKDDTIFRDILIHYQDYINDLKHRLETNAYQKLHNWSEAEKMAEEILSDIC